MTRRALLCLILGMASLTVSGCAGSSPHPHGGMRASSHDFERLEAHQRFVVDEPIALRRSQTAAGRFNAEIIFLADQIEQNANRNSLENTFVVTSIANLNNLAETTNFGRLVSENLIHELQVRHWKVFEVRLAKDITVNNTGEFSLSRDIDKIRDVYKIGGIVTGTYSVAEGSVILNVRVIDIATGIIVSSGQVRFSSNWFTESLLDGNDRQKVMKIVGDSPGAGRPKSAATDLESLKWLKIEDIAK